MCDDDVMMLCGELLFDDDVDDVVSVEVLLGFFMFVSVLVYVD